METKRFSNGFGQMDLTKDAFVKYWLETTYQYSAMFYKVDKSKELISFQCDLEDAAAKMWDEHKSDDINEVTI